MQQPLVNCLSKCVHSSFAMTDAVFLAIFEVIAGIPIKARNAADI